MANATQSITYFKFDGGLNTEASPLNMEPKFAKALSNIEVLSDGSVQTRAPIDFLGKSLTGTGTLYSSEDITSQNEGVVVTLQPFTYRNPKTGQSEKYILQRDGTELKVYAYDSLYTLRNLPDLVPDATLDLSPFIQSDVNIQTANIQLIYDSSVIVVIGRGITTCFIEKRDNSFVVEELSLHRRELGNNASRDAYVSKDGNTFKAIKRSVGISPISESLYVGDESKANWPLSLSNRDYITAGEAHWELYQQSHKDDINSNYDEEWTDKTTADPDDYYETNIKTLLEYYDDNKVSFGAGCVSNGRLWLTDLPQHPNVLYYSQTVDTGKEYGRFYAFADPYNYLDSDVVATDGGSLSISGAGTILNVIPLGTGVIVLATEGVWAIQGGSLGEGFSPTNMAINKLSSDGAISPYGYSEVENSIVYISKSSVNVISTDEISGTPKVQAASQNIDKFYRSIPQDSKEYAQTLYNPDQKLFYILVNFQNYPWVETSNRYKLPTRYKDVLILDLKTQAWYKYSLDDTDIDGTGGYIAGMLAVAGSFDTSEGLVTTISGETVYSEDGAEVTSVYSSSSADSNLVLPILAKEADGKVYYAVGTFNGTGTKDFEIDETIATTFDAYIETAHQVAGEVSHVKFTPYIYSIFERVENHALDDTVQGGCMMSVNRDFSDSAAYAKYDKNGRQVYKPWKTTEGFFEGSDPGLEVVYNKTKVRGRGYSFFIRFAKDGDKKFHLYGFQVVFSASKKV